MSDKKIKCTFSDVRRENKPKERNEIIEVQNTLKAMEISIEELAEALVHGASFRPGVLYGRKADDWKQQQLFGLDFDHNATIEENIIKRYRLVLFHALYILHFLIVIMSINSE